MTDQAAAAAAAAASAADDSWWPFHPSVGAGERSASPAPHSAGLYWTDPPEENKLLGAIRNILLQQCVLWRL